MNAFWIGFSTQKINGRLVGGTLSDGTTANTRLAGWLRKVVARNELTMRTRSMQLHRLLSARSRACAASQIDDNRLAFGSLWKDAKEWHKYDAFGAVRILAPNGTERATSLYKNRFLFTGREYAATFGFYEYRARAYNPTLGRFMSEDPKGFDAGDYNLFRYCHNDPLDLTDPMGLEVDAYLNEAQHLITVIDRDTGRSIVFRGGAGSEKLNAKGVPYRNNPSEERTRKLGPLPRGDYEILNRIPSAKGDAPLDGKRAYALEAKDGKRDDKERNTGRGTFRFHLGPSEGCVTTNDSKSFEKAGQILDATKKGTVTDANGTDCLWQVSCVFR